MTNLNKATIMIVDDTPDNIQLIHGVLADEYRIKAATSGEKALQILEQCEPPDLILLDVMMPGIDGFETCKIIKNQPHTANIPVVFITAKTNTNDEKTGFELGAVDYISKPIYPTTLKMRVKNQLALSDQARQLEQLVQLRTKEIEETRQKIVSRLGRAGEYRDNETGMHVMRMSHFCKILAQKVSINQVWIKMLFDASTMHDIGKIGIADSILLKPGMFTPAERLIMQSHTSIGADILGDDESPLLQMASEVALSHHERWDGTGYPQGLKGEDIPLTARIAAIADVFDALTSVRPYKNAWPNEDAYNYLIEHAGSHFDPELVPKFLECKEQIAAIQKEFSEDNPSKKSFSSIFV